MFTFHFQTKRHTNSGDSLYVVGNDDLLGNWNPRKGLLMKTNKKIYPYWKSNIIETEDYNGVIEIEYKYVLITKDGKIYWEEGNNRSLVDYLKIKNWEFDKDFKKRNTISVNFTTNSKTTVTSLFNELFELDKVYLSIKGDMKQSQYASLIHKDLDKKLIIFKLKYNYIKKNKLQTINMPYYCITFTGSTPVIEGPFEYYC